MNPEEILFARLALQGWIDSTHGLRGQERFTKENFLHGTWRTLASIVQWNKGNPLVQSSVREYQDLVPRAFTILTIRYGAYCGEPKKYSVMRDFVALLGKDLVEEELGACTYARGTESPFFGRLVKILDQIREIYGAEHFRLDALPPTPYHAYVLHALNSTDTLWRAQSNEELFGYLAVYDSMMYKTLQLTKSEVGRTARHGA